MLCTRGIIGADTQPILAGAAGGMGPERICPDVSAQFVPTARASRVMMRFALLLRFRNNRDGSDASVHQAGYLGSWGYVYMSSPLWLPP